MQGYKTVRTRMFPDKNIQGVKVSSMTMEEWQDFRGSLNMIGGSDVGTILGLNMYTDPMTLFMEKIGLKKKHFQGNHFTAAGHILEDSINRMAEYMGSDGEWATNFYAKRKFRTIKTVPYCLFNPKYPYLAANLDGRVVKDFEVDGVGISEIKTINGLYSSKFETGFPPQYIAQVQTYMMVTGCEYAVLTLLKDGRDLLQRYIYADLEIQMQIDSACRDFYAAMLEGMEVVKSNLTLEEKYEKVYNIQEKYGHVLNVSADDNLMKYYSEIHKENRFGGKMVDNMENPQEIIGDGGEMVALVDVLEDYCKYRDQEKEAKGNKLIAQKLITGYMTLNSLNKIKNVDGHSIGFKSRFSVTKVKENLGAQ